MPDAKDLPRNHPLALALEKLESFDFLNEECYSKCLPIVFPKTEALSPDQFEERLLQSKMFYLTKRLDLPCDENMRTLIQRHYSLMHLTPNLAPQCPFAKQSRVVMEQRELPKLPLTLLGKMNIAIIRSDMELGAPAFDKLPAILDFDKLLILSGKPFNAPALLKRVKLVILTGIVEDTQAKDWVDLMTKTVTFCTDDARLVARGSEATAGIALNAADLVATQLSQGMVPRQSAMQILMTAPFVFLSYGEDGWRRLEEFFREKMEYPGPSLIRSA